MKRAIISLATNRGNYYHGIARLADSLKDRTKADFIGFMGEAAIGAPLHTTTPYGFKLYVHLHVRNMGYDQVIWLDSSVYAVAPVDHLFDMLPQQGLIMQEAGCYVGQWCNEHTLQYFGLSRADAMQMLCYGNAGFLGFDWRHPNANKFFGQWWKAMDAGCFNGSWKDHRHDLSVGSIIANQMELSYIKGDQVLQYAAPETPLQNDTICLKAQGM